MLILKAQFETTVDQGHVVLAVEGWVMPFELLHSGAEFI